MDIEKLIETLRQRGVAYVRAYGRYCSICDEVVTALSTLQAENEQLRAELNDLKDKWDKYQPREHWETLNELCENLRDELDEKEKYYDQMIDALSATDSAELEQVKRERDEAVEYLRGQCRYCKRNLVCTSRKGPHSNCWEWRGPQKEG